MLTVCYPSPASQAALERLREAVKDVATIVQRSVAECEMIIAGRPSRAEISAATRLRWLVVPFAGVPPETLELARTAAASVPITLHNLHHNSAETAELAIALMLAAAKSLVPVDAAFRNHDWGAQYEQTSTLALEGRRALVVGLGEIGRRVARACLGLGMAVAGINTSGDRPEGLDGVEVQGVDSLFAQLSRADALLICVPFTERTKGLIGRAELAALPREAILVNVARGQIVDEESLYDALRQRRIHSAGLDVWYRYPEHDDTSAVGKSAAEAAKCTPPSAFPFHELDNVVMSPHRAGLSTRTEARRLELLAQLIRAAARGEQVPNLVSLERGY